MIIIFSSVFIISIIILVKGFKKFSGSFSGNPDSVKISIVTAAKNEARIIERFISSIKKLNYPKENFELILIDDNSNDETYSIAKQLIEDRSNFKIFKADDKTLPGKRGALQKGIDASQFPYILITDADCIPNPIWLQTCAAVFQRGYDFIFGPAPFYMEKNFTNKISCFENLKNQFLSFSLANFGLPYTASARNLGFTKKAFFNLGGYKNTTDTLSGDDDLLLREAVKNKLKTSAFYNKDAMVYSYTKKNLREYLNQKARHTQSSFHYSFKNRFVLGVWHLLNLCMLFAPVLFFIDINFIWLFLVKMFADIILISFAQKNFGYDFNIFEIILYDISYEIFIVINFFNALFKKVKWK